MKIKVTQDDIDNGRPKISHMCPIARAIVRKVPAAFIAYVYPTLKVVKIGDEKISLPNKASQFALDYDQGYPVKPFTFELNYEN